MSSDANIAAGPVTFFAARDLAHPANRRTFGEEGKSGGRWRGFKLLIMTSPPVEAAVTVARDDRAAFRLVYDPAHFKSDIAYIRREGDAQVVFGAWVDASPRDIAEFPGVVIARRPGCYRVTVTSELDPEPVTRVINVAMGRRDCPSGG